MFNYNYNGLIIVYASRFVRINETWKQTSDANLFVLK